MKIKLLSFVSVAQPTFNPQTGRYQIQVDGVNHKMRFLTIDCTVSVHNIIFSFKFPI